MDRFKDYMKRKQRERKIRIRNRRAVIVSLAVLVAAVGLMGGISYAKYYAAKFRQGIAVASGLYFNSNRLYTNQGDTTNIPGINTSGMMVNVNTRKWTGGDLPFDIEIRNYDNNLLFNDSNLNVEYEICFMLIEDPEGATYSVGKMEGGTLTGVQSLTRKNQVVKFTGGRLAGGTLNRELYQLTLHMTDQNAYNGARVLVVAYPTAPDYLRDDRNQQHRLVGLFQGVYSDAEMTVDTADFMVQKEDAYTADWKSAVEDVAGLIFNIRTIGDVAADEDNAMKQEAVLRWNSDYLEINQYDESYRAAGQKTGDIWTKQEDGHNWTYMKIKVLPYTSVNVTFYKTEAFINDFGSMTKTDFENLADANTEGVW